MGSHCARAIDSRIYHLKLSRHFIFFIVKPKTDSITEGSPKGDQLGFHINVDLLHNSSFANTLLNAKDIYIYIE